jgi:hypothetical protein
LALIDTEDQLQRASPCRIIGAFMLSDILHSRIACRDNKYHSVTADFLRLFYPNLICNYFENKIEFAANPK